MKTHKFDGERSGTGETCLAVIDGLKCYQRERHPVHQGAKTEVEGTEPGTYTVVVESYGEQALHWEGYANNVSDALHRALDQREGELGGEEA